MRRSRTSGSFSSSPKRRPRSTRIVQNRSGHVDSYRSHRSFSTVGSTVPCAECQVNHASKIRQAKMAAERAAKGAAGAAVVEKGLKKMITDSGANPKDAGVAEM